MAEGVFPKVDGDVWYASEVNEIYSRTTTASGTIPAESEIAGGPGSNITGSVAIPLINSDNFPLAFIGSWSHKGGGGTENAVVTFQMKGFDSTWRDVGSSELFANVSDTYVSGSARFAFRSDSQDYLFDVGSYWIRAIPYTDNNYTISGIDLRIRLINNFP